MNFISTNASRVQFNPKTYVFDNAILKNGEKGKIKKHGKFVGFFMQHFNEGKTVKVAKNGKVRTYTVSRKNFEILKNIAYAQLGCQEPVATFDKISVNPVAIKKLSKAEWKLVLASTTKDKQDKAFALNHAVELKRYIEAQSEDVAQGIQRSALTFLSEKGDTNSLMTALNYLVMTDQIHGYIIGRRDAFHIFNHITDLQRVSAQGKPEGFKQSFLTPGVQTKGALNNNGEGEPLFP